MDWTRSWISGRSAYGIALTGGVHIAAHTKRWGVSAEKPTKGEIIAERTAGVVWNVLEEIEAVGFLWNVFPLHPHKSDDPFTNRLHNARERNAGEELLVQLVLLLKPRRLVPIGNEAASTAHRLCGSQRVF